MPCPLLATRFLKSAGTCLVTIVACATATLSAQKMPTSNLDKGDEVQLQGCVLQGEAPGSFVFSRVTAWPVAKSPQGEFGPRHFWLANAADHLHGHVGQTIEVSGTITEVRESEIERNPGWNSKGGRRVAIELPVGDVFTSPDLAGINDEGRPSKTDLKITLLKVKIDSLLVVMPTCLPTIR
jgi:hypothetical protein